jgi:nucleoid-associated protein YgaU
VTVRPGDTLWAIARRVQPTGDVRPLVDQLVATYGSATLQPGQVVSIPR